MVNDPVRVVDRLSSLPDPLLFIIVSFLPFKDAARTSTLAKRWKHIWHSTKNIEFNEGFFMGQRDDNQGSTAEDKEIRRRVFFNFMLQWIQRYQEPIAEKFQLIFSRPKNYCLQMNQSIRFAIDHKVKVLDIDFSDPSWKKGSKTATRSTYLQLPLYDQHELLESLKLFSCYINVKQFNHFPALKTISLGWITLSDDSIKTLLSKCPILENLLLTNIYHVKNLAVVASSLRTLVVENCFEPERIYIDAPNLQLFMYSGELIDFQIERSNSMVEVVVDFGLENDCFEDYGHLLYCFLADVCSIRSLTVCSYMLQVISFVIDPALPNPVLPYLQRLTLKTALSVNEFYGITFFLNHCPSLEVLSIHIGNATIFESYEPPYPFEEHPFYTTHRDHKVVPFDCMMKTLKVVEIRGFKGKKNEILLLGYLLKYGGLLERLDVSVPRDMAPTMLQSDQILMQFARAAPHVAITLYVE